MPYTPTVWDSTKPKLTPELMNKLENGVVQVEADVSKNICTNLLNPTLGSLTSGGITCTPNVDGTYTFNGTAEKTLVFNVGNVTYKANKKYKIVGCPSGGSGSTYKIKAESSGAHNDIGNGTIFSYSANTSSQIGIVIYSGVTLNNVIFKPMLTTDLTATYDSFVEYAGGHEKLNSAVVELNSNLSELEYSDVAGGKNLFDGKIIVGEGTYAYFKLPKSNVHISISDRDTNVDIRNISIGLSQSVVPNPNTIIWTFVKNGTIVGRDSNDFISSIFTAKSLAIFPNDANTVTKILQRFNIQIEEGTTATPYEPYIPSVKMIAEEVNAQNESLSDLGKCKNLLNPTLQTTTQNGVTCTNNGDGTYTLNGTASGLTTFILRDMKLDSSLSYKLTGCPLGGDWDNGYSMYVEKQYWGIDIGKGYEITLTDASNMCGIYIRIIEGTVCNNLIFKPMITTDLSATYDDFVPYTGDGETLTHDVAELKNDLGSKVNFDRLLYANVSCEADQWTVIDNSVNWFQLNVIPILKSAYQNSSGNQAGGLLRINANTGGIEFKPDSYCDWVLVYLLKV